MGVRLCAGCFKPLKRRPAEKRAEFLSRKTCGAPCLSTHRKRLNAEARAALDAEDQGQGDGLTFDHDELLTAARRVAPDVPAGTLTAVIAAVLPLIEATTRARVLAPIAAAMRDRRTT